MSKVISDAPYAAITFRIIGAAMAVHNARCQRIR